MIDWGRIWRTLAGLAHYAGATYEEAEDAVQSAFYNLLRRRMDADRPYAYMKRAVLTETWRGYHKRGDSLVLDDLYGVGSTVVYEDIADARAMLRGMHPADIQSVVQYTETKGHSKAETLRMMLLRRKMREPCRPCAACGDKIPKQGRRADAVHCSERCARRLQKRRKDARSKELRGASPKHGVV